MANGLLADVNRVIDEQKVERFFLLIRVMWDEMIPNVIHNRILILSRRKGRVLLKNTRGILETMLLEVNKKRGVGVIHWCLPPDIPVPDELLSKEVSKEVFESAVKTNVPLIFN
jgi:hypothetical protein